MQSMFASGRLTAALLLATIATTPLAVNAQVNLQLINTIDGATFGTGNPGSVAAYGDTLYVGSLFSGGTITQINDPLGTPVSGGTLSGSLPLAGNGYVSLDTDGTTLVAASNNSAANDLVQVFDVATGSLRYEANPADLPTYSSGAQPTRIDGAAIDPNTGNVWLTAFGSGLPLVLDANSITDLSDDPSTLFGGSPTGTGFRDINFDSGTGDLYLRATNGVLGGERLGTTVDDFTTLNSAGANAGFSQIVGLNNVNLQDGFASAINIEFLPASFTGGEDIIITNTRDDFGVPDPVPFANQVLAFDANAGFDGSNPFSLNEEGVPVALNFLGSNGVSPFTTPGSVDGIYDFSFDPVNEVLYVADQGNGVIYIFGEPSGPSGVTGDYNNNGTVDAADYTLWRDNLGTAPSPLANDLTPGTVDSPGDYDTWVANFGNTASTTAIPEPAAAGLLLLSLGAMATRARV